MLIRFSRLCSGIAAVMFGAALLGCEPEIGDACTTSIECNGSDSDRICLSESTSGFPGGYCTEFNCGPNDCSEEASCVAYRAELAEACGNTGQSHRLQRSYCMRRCDTDDDCRSGYACVSVADGNPWGAAVISGNPGNERVCALAYTAPADAGTPENEVCIAAEPLPPNTATGSTAAEGDAGSGSQSSDGGASDSSVNQSLPVDASLSEDASQTDGASGADAG